LDVTTKRYAKKLGLFFGGKQALMVNTHSINCCTKVQK
jgi:hypothetical protein